MQQNVLNHADGANEEIANRKLQNANCKLEEQPDAIPKSKITNPKLPTPPRRRGLVILAAAAAAALLAGIIITIKNEKGETIAQFETQQPIAINNVAPGHKLIAENTGETPVVRGPSSVATDHGPPTTDKIENPKSQIQNFRRTRLRTSARTPKGKPAPLHPDCGAKGKVLDLWAAVHRLPLPEAADNLAATFHLLLPQKQRRGTRLLNNRRSSKKPNNSDKNQASSRPTPLDNQRCI